jgi:hypothetical protein
MLTPENTYIALPVLQALIAVQVVGSLWIKKL